jgi:hypothetical protein
MTEVPHGNTIANGRGCLSQKIFWEGPVFECEICHIKFGGQRGASQTFYDMRLANCGGRWALLCPSCALGGQGIGKLGLGFGQRYDLQSNGEKKWLLTSGNK